MSVLPLILVGALASCSTAFAQQDNGRLLWIGSDGNDPYTDEQVGFLVGKASSIVIAQFHAGFDIDAHHQLARRIKALDPSVRIFGYMSGTYVKTRFQWLDGVVVDDWLLRDRAGEPIVHKFRASGEVAAWFADLSNPEYRSFISGVAAEWMQIAPYDGIIFDASNYLHGDVSRTFLKAEPSHPQERTRFRDLLTQQKMDAVNAGLDALVRETKSALGDKLVVWNGFWRKGHTINRSLDLMPIGDVAVSERWSIARPTDPAAYYHGVLTRAEILEDLGIVQQGLAAGKSFFLKDTIDENWYDNAQPDALARLARFGWGMYMMIREPGRVSYGLSPGPRYYQNLDSDPVLLEPNAFGEATGPFVDLGAVLKRTFENGVVYMNPTPDPVDVVVRDSVSPLHGEGVPQLVTAGTTVTIPGSDAVFFTRPVDPAPNAIVPFGASTPGCQGPLTLDAVSSPWVGNPAFGFTAANAQPDTLGVLVLSGARRTAPLELHGVDVWIDLDSPFTATLAARSDAFGIASCPVPIPARPALVGFEFFAQLAVSDPCAPGGVAASGGLAITVR